MAILWDLQRALHEELGVRGVPHASLADFDSVFKFSS